MVELFGTEAIINMWTLIFGALFALGAFIFRKVVANDLLGWKFSVAGAIAGGSITFIILDNLFHMIKLSIGLSIAGWLAGGFLLGPILWDGEAGGGNEA